MLNVLIPALGTKKALWGVTGVSLFALVLTPELMVAFGAMLAIIFTGIVNVMNARTAAAKMEQLHVQAAETAVKVDGTAHRAEAQIALLQQQVTQLLADKAEKKETAAVLATETAAKTTGG